MTICRRSPVKNILRFIALLVPLFLLLLNTGCSHHRNVATCFYDSSEVLEKRIPSVLSSAPGVKVINHLWSESVSDRTCLCYEVQYNGDIDNLASWIRSKLRTSSVVPFRLVPKGNNRLEAYFDAGFD